MELELDYKRAVGSRSGTETCYTVEARYDFHSPLQIGKYIFDSRWRRVEFDRAAIGVPVCAPYQRQTLEHGMLGYAAAQALRWWLHAQADVLSGCWCLQTRLIQHKITYSHEIEAVSSHEHVGGEDRSHIKPG